MDEKGKVIQPLVRRAGLQSSGPGGLSTWDSTSRDPMASERSRLKIHGEGLQPGQVELLKAQMKGLFNHDPKVLCFSPVQPAAYLNSTTYLMPDELSAENPPVGKEGVFATGGAFLPFIRHI